MKRTRNIAVVATITPVPSDAELERLTADSLSEFNRAVRAGDFSSFHDTLAEVWKKETSAQQLRQVFQKFIDEDLERTRQVATEQGWLVTN